MIGAMAKKRTGPKAATSGEKAAAPSSSSTARAGAGGSRLVPLVIAVAALVGLAAWWLLRAPSFTVGVNANRNVLLVSIDTLRADALGSYGGRATTPNIDNLAAHGARFEFAHSHAVVTLVSHASLLTGHYPYEHGIRDNTGYRLPSSQATAATRLKTAGFATGAFIGGFPLDHRFGLSVGFDVYDDHLGRIVAGVESGERERRADAVVSSALDWIGKQQQKWFAFVHVYDPHAPYQPPAEWSAKFPADPYLGEVSFADSALGALFDRLAKESRPTLVVVTGDHGESLGDHGELTHSIFAYESTLHVPLIVGEIRPGDGAKARGVTISTPVRHIDVLPTLLEAVGAPASDGLPGVSMRGVIAAGRGLDRPSYFEAMSATIARGWAPLRGVLVGREKYIDLPIVELYDLASDPGETRNVASAKPDRAQALWNTLKTFNVLPPGRPQQETPDTVERLRSLGYIGGGAVTAREKYTEADDPKRLIQIDQALRQGIAAFQQGRIDDAIGLFKSVITRRPDTEDAYRQLALVYWRTGRPNDAIATLEAALRRGVTQSEVRIKLGQYLSQAGQSAKAIALLESFAGDDPDALVALGNAYDLAGRSADAIRTFRHLIAVDPSNGLAYENIGTIQLEKNDNASAEASLRQALKIDPNLPAAYTALGVALTRNGRKAEAIDAWKRAVELDATEFDALGNLTRTLVEAGRMDEARTYGGRFIATAPPGLKQDVETIRRLIGKS
jgi:arylsulfatase A-like enzyme/Flp pilus assembly protein TadD